MNTFYCDCEFNGHNGDIISIALVPGFAGVKTPETSFYAYCDDMFKADAVFLDPWVKENVYAAHESIPMNQNIRIRKIERHRIGLFGAAIHNYLRAAMLGRHGPMHFVADSVVDIKYLCNALSTGGNGDWHSVHGDMSFAVYDVDSYPTELPGAVRHNAWWDAKALKYQVTGGL